MKKYNLIPMTFEERTIRYGIKPPQLTGVELNRITQAKEQFGVKTLSIEDLNKLNLTPQNLELIQRNIARENKIITGEYKKDRDDAYLKNYVDILSKAGANPDLLDRLQDIISKVNSSILEKFPISALLPPLKEFYITLKRGRDKRGRFISITDQVDTMEEQLKLALDDIEALGYV